MLRSITCVKQPCPFDNNTGIADLSNLKLTYINSTTFDTVSVVEHGLLSVSKFEPLHRYVIAIYGKHGTAP